MKVKTKKMAKPILIVRVPNESFEAMSSEKEQGTYVDDGMKRIDDYHVIVVNDGSIEEIKFEAFNDKDFKEIQLDELKKHIESIISKN